MQSAGDATHAANFLSTAYFDSISETVNATDKDMKSTS